MGSESQATHRNDPPPSAAQVMHLRARDSAGLGFVGAAVSLTGLSLYLASQASLAPWLAGQVLLEHLPRNGNPFRRRVLLRSFTRPPHPRDDAVRH